MHTLRIHRFPHRAVRGKFEGEGVTDSEEDEHVEVKRGTKIIFLLEVDQSEFLEERRMWDLVVFLSEFIGFPTELHVEKIEGEGSDRFGRRWYTWRSSEARRSFLTSGRNQSEFGGLTLEGSGGYFSLNSSASPPSCT